MIPSNAAACLSCTAKPCAGASHRGSESRGSRLRRITCWPRRSARSGRRYSAPKAKHREAEPTIGGGSLILFAEVHGRLGSRLRPPIFGRAQVKKGPPALPRELVLTACKCGANIPLDGGRVDDAKV